MADPFPWPAGQSPRLLVSTQTYELGKRLGPEAAAREFARMCERPTTGDLPVARMVARLRTLGAVALYHAASTSLPKLRSRAAHAALHSKCDFWVMIDDDVECDTATLARLLTLAGGPASARIAVLPCLLRGTSTERHRLNLEFDGSTLQDFDGVTYRAVKRAGCGCMVVTRQALVVLDARFEQDLSFVDEDGVEKVALFDMLFCGTEPRWLNEDLSFSERARRCDIPIVAPIDGVSVHDKHQLPLHEIVRV